MAEEALINIFMVTYNHEQYIAQAIEGVLAQQTGFSWQLIIGDDFSTDGTRQICIDYQERYPDKIRLLLHEKNLGGGGKNNARAVFEACQGKYIAICEGDDYWTDPLKLQKMVGFLEAHPDFVLCFHKVMIEKAGELVEDYITNVPAEITTQADLLEKNNYIHTPSVVFRNRQDFPDWYYRAMPGDFPLYVLLTNGGGKIKYFDEVMAVYRVHHTGIWSMADTQKFDQQRCFTMLNCARMANFKDERIIKPYVLLFADSIYIEGYKHLNKSEYMSLIRWAIRWIRFSPRQLAFLLSPNIRRLIKSR
jgi:glycosyltransferase involved in cell wall biosynthesis